MTPILPPDALRRLDWIKPGIVRCVKDFYSFCAGNDYQIKPQLVRVTWQQQKSNGLGQIHRVEYTGLENGFIVEDAGGFGRWFCEQRLGRRASVQPITEQDFTLQDLIAHFEIPQVPDLAIERKGDYEAAKERIKWLTTPREQ